MKVLGQPTLKGPEEIDDSEVSAFGKNAQRTGGHEENDAAGAIEDEGKKRRDVDEEGGTAAIPGKDDDAESKDGGHQP